MNQGAEVSAEHVVDDDWLSLSHKDRCFGRGTSPVSKTAVADFVVLDLAVGNTHLRAVVNLDNVETIEVPFNRSDPAAKRHQRVVNAASSRCVEDQSAPIANRRDLGLAIVGRVERTTRSESIVLQRRKHDGIFRRAFCDQVSVTTQQFDARITQFDNHARIDRQSATQSSDTVKRAAWVADDFQVLGNHMHDVCVIESSGQVQTIDRRAENGFDADEKPVERVVDNSVAADFWSDPTTRIIERIRIGRHRETRTQRNRVVGDGRATGHDMDRAKHLIHRIDIHFSATVTQVGEVDVVQENASGIRGRGEIHHVGILAKD